MTGMEQGLRYIEREIRFMVKDQFGNSTYTKYADRVVEDACGIPNFCSTVLSSKKPLTVILKAVRGPRGDVIMRFFNASLHDARIEMVMVLAEAIKLRTYKNRTSRDTHEYLMKLYRRAIKRTIRLITGSKNKESYKSLYRSLRSYAKMDDLDYDDDDEEDEDDEYFDNLGEFGDSDFAEACLDAYRDGKTPSDDSLNLRAGYIGQMNLSGNEEILKEIAAIESRIGRHLTDAELDKLLCGDEDDDSEYSDSNLPQIKSDKVIDDIVDMIYERLAKKLGIPSDDKNESLDDYIERQENEQKSEHKLQRAVEIPSTESAREISEHSAIPENPSLENLVEMHNHLKGSNEPQVEVGAAREESAESTSDDDGESSHLPPDESSGGTVLMASTSDNVSETEKNRYMLDDAIRDCDIYVNTLIPQIENSFRANLSMIGVGVTDIFICLEPSTDPDHLFTLSSTIRVTGDYETINTMHLNMIITSYISKLCEHFEISGDMIDRQLNIIDSSTTYAENIDALGTFMTTKDAIETISGINRAISALALYIYRKHNILMDIRYVNDIGNVKLVDHKISDDLLHENNSGMNLSLYLTPKKSSMTKDAFESFVRDKVTSSGIVDIIFDNFNIHAPITCNANFEFLNEDLIERVKKNLSLEYAAPYSRRSIDFLISSISSLNINAVLYTTHNISSAHSKIYFDLMYRINLESDLSSSDKKEIENQFKINGEYCVELRDALRLISSSIDVTVYPIYSIVSDDEEESSEDEDSATQTSNFGI